MRVCCGLVLLGCTLRLGRSHGATPSEEDVTSLIQHQHGVALGALRGEEREVGDNERISRELLNKRGHISRLTFRDMSELDAGVHDDPYLVVNHLGKTGGSFIKHTLRHVIPGENLHVENETDEVLAKDLEAGTFVIGMVRNPFEYYVSLWSFYAVQKSFGWAQQAMTEEQRRTMLARTRPWGSTQEDLARFKQWLFAMNSRDLGVESLKFYGCYLSHVTEQPRLDRLDWTGKNTRDPSVCNVSAAVNQALADFDSSRLAAAPGPVSCWVQTENIADDLQHCLERFEQEAGSSIVDWDGFENLRGKPINPSDHAPCAVFYDAESLALVKEADKHIISAFGYPSHCEPAS